MCTETRERSPTTPGLRDEDRARLPRPPALPKTPLGGHPGDWDLAVLHGPDASGVLLADRTTSARAGALDSTPA
jgi:hypothetical protein